MVSEGARWDAPAGFVGDGAGSFIVTVLRVRRNLNVNQLFAVDRFAAQPGK
jgi:hypothetical protein